MQVFCVRDRKAQVVVGQVFTDSSIVQATRSFQRACENNDSVFSRHPDDFEMLHLGEFDQRGLKFNLLDLPAVICSPRDFVKSS